ncbi:unnamed protein product [Bursaphelenchus xylophilus]|uniref:(pine wood nematode) hypothetical protein n=1 Tax=Bursaphelenchus xylophilus TaxID=6326 RepID=A0A1I7SVA5_BURXY|nr:unnamed protein product [Bursaphelenchus xylophilus]CAG9101147.1 unnamed protein product [Bursaphelenchus xylophilus]
MDDIYISAGPSNAPSYAPSLSMDDPSEMESDLTIQTLARTFSNFERMRRNSQLCDVKIKCENSFFLAHRCILAAAIPFFNAMFNTEFVESKMQECEINQMSSDSLEAIIDFVYTGKIHLTIQNVTDLLVAADYFQLDILSAECASFLEVKITHSNVMEVRQIALRHNCKKAVKAADRFIQRHFVALSATRSFLRLDLESVCEFFAMDELHVESEEEIYHAAMRWVNYDEERKKSAAEILRHVRLTLLDKAFLIDEVATNPIVHDSISCRDLFDEVKEFHLVPERRPKMMKFRLESRHCSEIPGIIYACGGLGMNTDYRPASKAEMYDPLAKKWMPVSSMNSVRTRVGVAAFNGKLYVMGGYNGQVRLDLVEVFDPNRNQWTHSQPLLTKRSAMATVVYRDKIYVIGGFDGQSIAEVETYSPITGERRFISPMLCPRSAAGAVVLKGCIYVTGGHNSFAIYPTVEKYDFAKAQWTYQKPMNKARCRHAAVVYDEKIYAIGGYDGREFLRCTEVYDPETDSWQYGPELNLRRGRVSACVNGSAIYAIGGYLGEIKHCSMEILQMHPEPFDLTGRYVAPNKKMTKHELIWRIGPKMKLHEGGVSIGVIPISPKKLCRISQCEEDEDDVISAVKSISLDDSGSEDIPRYSE